MAINKQIIIQPKVAKNHLAKFVKNLEDEGIKMVFADPKSLTKSKISNFLFDNKKNIETIQKMHPLKRLGEGKDIASLAKFLLTPENSWITGQIIGIDGGRSAIA